jgi:lactate dehydrogenase-like 2-hydroxyacid dehydrogenase
VASANIPGPLGSVNSKMTRGLGGECPNAVLAPHIASASREARTRMATMAVENCLAVLEGSRPANPVNREVLPR